jgi:hypothetical protein
MAQHDLRTYRRRNATRKSGYHTCETTTGGECIIKKADRYICKNETEVFNFHRNSLNMVELFENGISLIAFGGYIHSEQRAEISLAMCYSYEGQVYSVDKGVVATVEEKSWENIGFHSEQPINLSYQILDVNVRMTVKSCPDNVLDFISFDFDVVSKDEFSNKSCAVSFYQKTFVNVSYLYYLNTELPFNTYLTENLPLSEGRQVVLKSCNRCGRYLPINEDDEMKTLSFSLHCKKRAPCVHSTFHLYKIMNTDSLGCIDLSQYKIEESTNKLISYYGHQLECKACKKFFVNAPLNPQRNPQQFKEDGLRRRAIEVLVNKLLERNIVHFEFEKRTKKEFSRYIWEKFDKRCFKCGKDSNPIKLGEMALDHTMPLAYLYRLDETATCLCSSHNSQKSDNFPVDFYSEDELKQLSSITGLDMKTLHTKEVNHTVLNLLIANVVWFYDDFLMDADYQKIRDGIKTADKINDALKRVISGEVDLAEEYKKIKGHYPESVTIE